MEHFNSESHYVDEDSGESSSDGRPTRRVAVPATALHGVVGVGRESARAPEVLPAPRLEALFAGERHHRQEAASLGGEYTGNDKDDDDDENAPKTVAPTQAAPAYHPDKVAAAVERAAGQGIGVESPPRDSEGAAEIELNQEAIDAAFQDIVEISLHDLQNLPTKEREPGALDPPVAEVEARTPLYETPGPPPRVAVPSSTVPPRPRAEAEPPATPDFSSFEGDLPAPAAAEATAAEEPEFETMSGNLPPPPPEHPYGETSESPEPDPGDSGNTAAYYSRASRPNMSYGGSMQFSPNHLLSPAQRLYIDDRLQQVEAARRRGDVITGLIAGWALVRTFRNRRMINQHAKETKKQLTAQEKAIAGLTQQNNTLRERASRAEQQSRQQQFNPNRFRPAAAAETVAARPATIGPEAAPQAAAAAEAEKARLMQMQYEEALRQQALETLEVPPEHEVVRSQWHSIEVDKKTGKAVEQPTGFEYGEAFQRERRSEQLQDKLQDASAPGQNAGAAFGASQQYGAQPQLPGPGTDQQFGAPAAPRSKADILKSTGKQITSTAANPWFWAAIIFLMIVFFTAAWF